LLYNTFVDEIQKKRIYGSLQKKRKNQELLISRR